MLAELPSHSAQCCETFNTVESVLNHIVDAAGMPPELVNWKLEGGLVGARTKY